jgi:hypothetical protein
MKYYNLEYCDQHIVPNQKITKSNWYNKIMITNL